MPESLLSGAKGRFIFSLTLYEEIEAWQKAYEDYADILMEHGLI